MASWTATSKDELSESAVRDFGVCVVMRKGNRVHWQLFKRIGNKLCVCHPWQVDCESQCKSKCKL